jgi:hypothetical protein
MSAAYPQIQKLQKALKWDKSQKQNKIPPRYIISSYRKPKIKVGGGGNLKETRGKICHLLRNKE